MKLGRIPVFVGVGLEEVEERRSSFAASSVASCTDVSATTDRTQRSPI